MDIIYKSSALLQNSYGNQIEIIVINTDMLQTAYISYHYHYRHIMGSPILSIIITIENLIHILQKSSLLLQNHMETLQNKSSSSSLQKSYRHPIEIIIISIIEILFEIRQKSSSSSPQNSYGHPPEIIIITREILCTSCIHHHHHYGTSILQNHHHHYRTPIEILQNSIETPWNSF